MFIPFILRKIRRLIFFIRVLLILTIGFSILNYFTITVKDSEYEKKWSATKKEIQIYKLTSTH